MGREKERVVDKPLLRYFIAIILEVVPPDFCDSVTQPHLQMWSPIHRCRKQLLTSVAYSRFKVASQIFVC